jgi:hypothetical protein
VKLSCKPVLFLLQNVNTCPVDRRMFTVILVRRCVEGKVIRRIPVEPPRQQDEDEDQEDPTYCEVSVCHVLLFDTVS